VTATIAQPGVGFTREKRRWIDPTAGIELRHPSANDLRHIPGRRGLPWLGIMPEVIQDPMRFAASMVAKHGLVYRFHALGRWHVHLAGARANELILFDPDGIFSAAEGWGPLIGGLFPGALLIQDGAEHRANRRLLGEAFRQAQLTGYQDIFAKDIRAAISEWSGRTIDSYREIKRLTFRISATTFLGLPLEERALEAIGAFSRMMAGLLTIVSNPRLSYVRARGHRARRRLEILLTSLIEEKRASPGRDFLSRITHLHEEGRELTTKEIVDSFIFLLTASHDTLASALTSTTYYLAAEPQWAARLRDEADAAVLSDSCEAATAELPLHDMFFKEVLRLNGPAPVIWRRAVREFECHGYRIPAGTMTGANLMMTHRLPELWERPLEFDPNRFAPENERKMDRFAYAPFSGGVHKCLGLHFSVQQARIFMVELLRRCDLELKNEAPVQWYHWPNCRPRNPLPIAVRPRCRGS
jgi:cytochrome P450